MASTSTTRTKTATDCAQVFERLAEREQEMIGELITCLQKRIGQETER
jgi:hypothetical protein